MSAPPITDLPDDQCRYDTHISTVGGHPLDRGHAAGEPHEHSATVEPSPHLGHAIPATQRAPAEVGGPSPADPREAPTPSVHPGRPEDIVLAILADSLDDFERTRIAAENRVRSLGQVKGLAGTPVEQRLAGMVDGLKALEHDAELQLRRAVRKHPLGPWVASMKGVGAKQAGRLIAAIGDPYIHSVTGQPRTVSQLWAYAGYHVLAASHIRNEPHGLTAGGDTSQGGAAGQLGSEAHGRRAGVAPSRARGQRANWNPDAKMRAFLVAESCVKQLRKPCHKPEGQAWANHTLDCQCSYYRFVYDTGREKYADAVHQVECKRCGPSGKPALPGSPLSAAHQHARALRLVSKEILRSMWLASKSHPRGGPVAAGHRAVTTSA
jgi:hypothetical protein